MNSTSAKYNMDNSNCAKYFAGKHDNDILIFDKTYAGFI